jgi:hypothetical protein
MQLGTYIMANESISIAYFINPSHQSYVCMCIPLIVARQRLGKHVPATTNARSNRRIVGSVICMWAVSYRWRVHGSARVRQITRLSIRGNAEDAVHRQHQELTLRWTKLRAQMVLWQLPRQRMKMKTINVHCCINPSSRTGVDSVSNLPENKGRPARKADNFTAI